MEIFNIAIHTSRGTENRPNSSRSEPLILPIDVPSTKTHSLFPPELVKVLSKSHLIINSSSIGMYPNEDDSPTKIGESFNSNQIVFDIVYNPISTKLLKIASREGATTINGLKMFVEQGAKSFELWTGKKMPRQEITESLKEQLKRD